MSLSVKVAENGDHKLGQVVDGVFVTYLTIPGFRVQQQVDAGKDNEAASASDKTKGGE